MIFKHPTRPTSVIIIIINHHHQPSLAVRQKTPWRTTKTQTIDRRPSSRDALSMTAGDDVETYRDSQARCAVRVARERDADDWEITFERDSVHAIARAALALALAMAFVNAFAAAAFVATFAAAFGASDARVARGRFARGVGVYVESETWWRSTRGVLIESEDVEAFATREAVSTTDVWYQILCVRKRGLEPVVLFPEFRFSAISVAVVLDIAQRCFELSE